MTDRLENLNAEPRRLSCAGCGTEFSCALSGLCWCAGETVRLPMPTDNGDCLCQACLRKAAAEAQHTPPSLRGA